MTLPKRYPLATWVESPNFYRDRALDAKIITCHTTEGSEKPRSALWSAQWCTRPETEATAHFFVDDKNIYQSVECDRQAWHCAGGNPYSIGIEFAGAAAQKPEQWADDFSTAMLRNASELLVWISLNASIPLVQLSSDALALFKARKIQCPRGVTGHRDWVRAGFGGDHQDPGESFPYDPLLMAANMLGAFK